MTIRLFISHSSPERPSQERLAALVSAITAEGDGAIKVLYDKEQIQNGDEWRRRISYLLHACDAAVVLLDEAALESDWVLAEATFLSIRQAVESQFRLVPVSFLDDTDLSDRRAILSVQREQLGKSTWQPVSLLDLQFALGDTPAEIADLVVGALRARGNLDSRANLVERLADQLVPLLGDAPTGGLRGLAEQLGDDVPYLSDDEHKRGALAIARHMIREASLAAARQQLSCLGTHFWDKHGFDILDSLSPLPFDVEAAVLLLRERANGAYAHSWLQTGQPAFSAPLYLRRAHLPDNPGNCLMLLTRHATVESVRAEIRMEYRRVWAGALARRPQGVRRELTDADIDARLKDAPKMRVCLAPIDQAMLRQLEQDYPNLAFVMYHDVDDSTTPPAGVLRVVPALDPKRELQILVEYDNAHI